MAKVKIGPDYVCTSCPRMLYKHTVVTFKRTKYSKAGSELLGKIAEHAYVSKIDGKQWLCRPCDGSLSRCVLPKQAKANGMELDYEPEELKCLNALERRFISLRVPFMKMVALPTGKQRCIHGPAMNVPSKVDRVCTMLPRLSSECELVPLKLKRKLSYKGHYMYDYVSPEKLANALKWLKANNPLYTDIDIADNWLDDAIADDEELVLSMLEQDDPMDHSNGDTVCNHGNSEPKDVNSNVCNFSKSNESEQSNDSGSKSGQPDDAQQGMPIGNPVSVYAKELETFVKQQGLAIHDVPVVCSVQ